jgi:hypothetical protein
VDANCETCLALRNALADVNERLALAAAQVRTLAGPGRPEKFDTALRDSASLRMESQTLRAELERHTAEHES